MAGAHTGNGSGGPFNGRDIRCALERLDWRIVEEPGADELAMFVHPDVEKAIPVNLDQENIYYGDTYFSSMAAVMISEHVLRDLAGRTRRLTIEDKMLELRTAVMACRDHVEWDGGVSHTG